MMGSEGPRDGDEMKDGMAEHRLDFGLSVMAG